MLSCIGDILKVKTNRKPIGLCNRCEHRALFEETGHGPRWECKQPGRSVYSCYMYTPVLPIMLEVNDGDSRPIDAGWMIAPRSHAVGVACDKVDVELCIHKDSKSFMKYWSPIKKKRKKQ